MTELYSRRSFLAGVLTSGTLSAGAGYVLTRREPVVLVLATGADTTGGRQLLVTMWNQLNPDAQIRTETINSSTGDQYEKFLSKKADIFNLDVIHIPRFADDNRIVPITPREGHSLLPAVRRLSQRPGHDDFWAIPFNTDVGMLYRRITDKSVADVEPELADLITKAPGQFAGQLNTVSPQTDEAFVVNVLEHALAQDDAILTEDGTLSFSLGQWREALGPVAAAVRSGRVTDEAGEGDTTRTFQRFGLRYMRNWPVSYPAVDRAERTKVSTAEIRLGGLPTGIIGGQSLAVSATSENKDIAEQAIHFLTGTSSQLLLAKYGFAPTELDAYIDQRLAESLPHLKYIRYAVESSRPRPMHRGYASFARVFAQHTHRLIKDGEQLTQRFIQDMQKEIG
ncbi:ABC transporter-binding protein [Paractinoplanes brasiliensis]|uniref:Multiple sugar transport system substrate-binding protein n=1 Tax=Paractinoplanes brasiliensis TaxID=52695 RepID=A0A4R6JTD2_9ACTN|nr:ABC transporter-binding protein [Actinoplanes brasiliensis]TDO37955.1 multiple sugar transport system substrate-binding protein [Actinoplanes brasiliensis]GID31046.1 sugar ABC transporter substrate-binding protein [Actinoplanes brasiliensis]